MTIFELRPHCDQAVADPCAAYDVRDPQSKQTPSVAIGDILDMDLIIHNPARKPIRRFRAWIAYDPSQLHGEQIEIDPAFPIPTPEERNFSNNDGYIKVSGYSEEDIMNEIQVVARLRLRVLATRGGGTPLTFYDVPTTPDPETGIFSGAGTQEENIADSVDGYLLVKMENNASNSSIATSASTISSMQSSSTSAFSSPSNSNVFTLLQVQNVRVTTQGSSVYLAWEPLQSAELVAYNIYYGTTTGRYIQRRSIEKDATSLALRSLPLKTTYYFSVRGVKADGRETEFSNEVGVRVGDPKTSTSPLVGSFLSPSSPKTDGSVQGETGLPSIIIPLLTISAMAGTFIAYRRQTATNHLRAL